MLFRRYSPPMAHLSNSRTKPSSIAVTAQKLLNVTCAATQVNRIGTRLRFWRMNGAWRTSLGEISGLQFISLQKGAPAAEAARPPQGMKLHDFTEDLHDFADAAALIDNLDLVISIDTAIAHLAGALGKPVWVLNRFDTCFRWPRDRDDSPWYPSLRQFRQPTPGDWDSVIIRARGALQRLAAGDRGQLRPPTQTS